MTAQSANDEDPTAVRSSTEGAESDLIIDRPTASRLGITSAQIDNTLYDAFSQRQVSVIYSALNQYHVVMEIDPRYTQYPAAAALESEGTILRGRFDAGVNDEQWCDRRLLARIHHTTIRRLRSEIEPVAARDFLGFLFAWQHVGDDTRL